jgi:hypothetical protein
VLPMTRDGHHDDRRLVGQNELAASTSALQPTHLSVAELQALALCFRMTSEYTACYDVPRDEWGTCFGRLYAENIVVADPANGFLEGRELLVESLAEYPPDTRTITVDARKARFVRGYNQQSIPLMRAASHASVHYPPTSQARFVPGSNQTTVQCAYEGFTFNSSASQIWGVMQLGQYADGVTLGEDGDLGKWSIEMDLGPLAYSANQVEWYFGTHAAVRSKRLAGETSMRGDLQLQTSDQSAGSAMHACSAATSKWSHTFHAVKTGAKPATAMNALYAPDVLVSDPLNNGFSTGVDTAVANVLNAWQLDTLTTAPMVSRFVGANHMDCAYNISWAEHALPGSQTNVAAGIMSLNRGMDGAWRISLDVSPLPADMDTYSFETNFGGPQDASPPPSP